MEETPRQLMSAVMLFGCLVTFAIFPDSYFGAQPGSAFRKCAVTLLVFLLVYCMLNTRDGVLDRPHPALWRLLHGWNLWYCLIVVAVFVVPVDQGVTIFQWLFPGVEQKQLVTETLGYDHLTCAINTANVKRQFFSIWFFAHCVGWCAKMLILRSWSTCIIYSTVFELTELTLQCVVPEFQECWWDSIFMDWLIANTLIGMTTGWLLLKFFRVSRFDWTPCNNRGLQALQLALQHLTPASLGEYAWNPENDPTTLVLNAVIWIVMAVAEVNTFFLINIMHLPRDHPFNAARQFFFCVTAVPAVEEWYEYTRHIRAKNLGKEWFEYTVQFKGRKPRIGHFTWLLTITVCIETAAVVKYSIGLGQLKWDRFGPDIWVPWLMFLGLFGLYFVIHCWLFHRKERGYPCWLRILKWSSCMPLLSLLRLYAF